MIPGNHVLFILCFATVWASRTLVYTVDKQEYNFQGTEACGIGCMLFSFLPSFFDIDLIGG